MGDAPQRFFEFENFLVDSQQRLVFRDGEPLDLTPKVFDVLLELVESSGRIVAKNELMESVWPDSFVEESNLTQHISTLRKKLGQDGTQRLIVTVPGRGYRFVAPVKTWDDDAVVTVSERVRSRVTITNAGTSAGEPMEVAPVPPKVRAGSPRSAWRRYLWAIPVIIVAALGGVLIARYFRRSPPPPPFTNVHLTRFTTEGNVVTAAISPNGKQVAYAETVAGGKHSLWVRQVTTSNTGVQIIGPATWRYNTLAFSPDSDYVYFTAQEINSPSILYRVPALGGTPTKLIDDVDSAVTFSPDGKRIAFLRGYPDAKETVVLIANTDGSGETRLSSFKDPAVQLNLGPGPGWSPDGETVACSVSESSEAETHQELYLINARTGDAKPLTHNKWSRVFRVAWTKDPLSVIMTAADADTPELQVWQIAYPSGRGRRITNDLNDYKTLTVTADSQIAAVVQTDEQGNVWLAPSIDGQNAAQITSANYDGFDGLSWAADGQIVYSATRNGLQGIWLSDSQGKQKKQLTENAGQNIWPVVSPDGRTIVFTSTRDGQRRLWRIDVDGSHLHRLTDGPRDITPVFSPDGKWLFYLSAQVGSRIMKMAANGGVANVLFNDGLPGPPVVSPDGKTLAFTFRKPALGKLRLALLPVDLSSPLKILDTTDVPRRSLIQWTADGKGLAYVKVGGVVSNIWVQPIDGGAPRQVTSFDSQLIYNFAISRDGRLAMSRGRQTNDVVLISSVP